MPEQKLNKSLEELRQEINNLGGVDEQSQARINQIIDRIQRRVNEPELIDQHDLVEDVEDAIRHFEISHPTLAGVLNNIMTTLSNMGI